jgi:hypothetical protein
MSSLAGGLNYLKKYLLKGIDLETADSKGLKTLALCWAYRKRAFSVSGSFRKALSDLITDMHNSNKKRVQITLSGEIIAEDRYALLGFVSIDVLEVNSKLWFLVLNAEQVSRVAKLLSNKFNY